MSENMAMALLHTHLQVSGRHQGQMMITFVYFDPVDGWDFHSRSTIHRLGCGLRVESHSLLKKPQIAMRCSRVRLLQLGLHCWAQVGGFLEMEMAVVGQTKSVTVTTDYMLLHNHLGSFLVSRHRNLVSSHISKPFAHRRLLSTISRSMGKKHSTPGEEYLLLPAPPTTLPVVDTHTHVAATFDFYRGRYKNGVHTNVFDFVKGMYTGRNVEALLDVWCEAPVQKLWKDYADAAIEENGKKWGGIQYWFALGAYILF